MNAIEVQEISKSYKNYELSDVTFQVPKGYITGLIGPNGAGKSTIIKMIMGIVASDQGSIQVLGQDTRGMRLYIRRRSVTFPMRIFFMTG
ncbi:ATP-binding cassette domain-containing protein [Paenibacillus sp. D2_2]|nr:ATP-binding cassette domain-containing protein [Paenibacillus sp. D2_2]WMT39078.1 ATP-binding cassette domain-containing protein [Paenibacillus sp. D2_2]